MENPKEFKYSKDHEWIKVDGDEAIIGITHHAQDQLTDIVFVELPDVGKNIEKDNLLGVVESVKSVSDILSPISGQVIKINDELIEKPELINEDPFGKGWIVKIKIKEISELNSLMSSEEYKALIG